MIVNLLIDANIQIVIVILALLHLLIVDAQKKELINLPAKDNKKRWISFLQKFNAIGGSVVTLIKLISLFANN